MTTIYYGVQVSLAMVVTETR